MGDPDAEGRRVHAPALDGERGCCSRYLLRGEQFMPWHPVDAERQKPERRPSRARERRPRTEGGGGRMTSGRWPAVRRQARQELERGGFPVEPREHVMHDRHACKAVRVLRGGGGLSCSSSGLRFGPGAPTRSFNFQAPAGFLLCPGGVPPHDIAANALAMSLPACQSN